MANVDVTRVAGNIAALNSLYSLQNINSQLATHQARLSTGKRLMSAADDPAGMSIATTFDIRRQALKTTLSAIGDSKNLLSTMEGGLKKIQDILVKMQNKALEASGSTIGASERQAIQSQLKEYASEIDDIAKSSRWNNEYLLVGAGGSGSSRDLAFLVGADIGVSGSSMTFGFKAVAGGINANQGFMSTGSAAGQTGLGLDDVDDLVYSGGTGSGAPSAAVSIDSALTIVKQAISQVGATTARLTFKEESLSVQHANTEAAYNRIMNANMAEEQVEASKLLILQQTATASLAQANSAPQFLLELFR